MSKERELLNEVLEYFDPLGLNIEHCGDLPERIKEFLAQPEQTKRSPLTEAEISKTLKLCRRSTEWDYGFEAGVSFAEEFHGIEL